MAQGRYIRGALGQLQELFDRAVKEVGLLGEQSGNEWMTGAHTHSRPDDVTRMLVTSGSENHIKNDDAGKVFSYLNPHKRERERMNRSIARNNEPMFELDDYLTRVSNPREHGDDYFTLHNHPNDYPVPSEGDLHVFSAMLPSPRQQRMAIIGTNRDAGREEFPLTITGPTYDELPHGLGWYPSAFDARYRRLGPDRETRADLDALLRHHVEDYRSPHEEVLKYRTMLPMMELGQRGKLDFRYDLSPSAAYTNVDDPNALAEELHGLMRRRGLLDYAEGGRVPRDYADRLDLTDEERRLLRHHLDELAHPVVNDDGSISTVLQMPARGPDGRYHNIPRVWDGEVLEPGAAVDRAGDLLGWPGYGSPDEADARYMRMHPLMEQ